MGVQMIRVSCPNQRLASEIADRAVETRLAACANIEGPVMSTYRWRGVVEQAWEFLLWLKAPRENFSALEALVTELHPYDVPGIVALDCHQVSAPYADWLKENTDIS
jgi:periplasmic divalent cation tolerance protein